MAAAAPRREVARSRPADEAEAQQPHVVRQLVDAERAQPRVRPVVEAQLEFARVLVLAEQERAAVGHAHAERLEAIAVEDHARAAERIGGDARPLHLERDDAPGALEGGEVERHGEAPVIRWRTYRRKRCSRATWDNFNGAACTGTP